MELLARLVQSKDFLSGVMFTAFGVLGLALASNLRLGTASQMGPAYFPIILCWGTIGVGIIVGARAVISGAVDKIEISRLKPIFLILAAILLFGALLVTMGLVLASLALILVASLAGLNWRPFETAMVAIGLTVFAVALFVWGLSLSIPVWPV